MVRQSVASHLILAAVLLACSVCASASAFKSFDFPGATETVLNDINNKNTAVGYYLDQLGIAHGFVATESGHLTSVDFPDSTATYAYGINDSDQIVGWYVDSLGTEHGYVCHSGQFTTIDPPNSTDTRAWDISNGNPVIVGTYFDPAYGQYRGFSYQSGGYGGYDPPGATHTEICLGAQHVENFVGIHETGVLFIEGEHGFNRDDVNEISG